MSASKYIYSLCSQESVAFIEEVEAGSSHEVPKLEEKQREGHISCFAGEEEMNAHRASLIMRGWKVIKINLQHDVQRSLSASDSLCLFKTQ